MLFHQSTAEAMKKTCYFYTFYNENHSTYLYITCNYLSLLWEFTDFFILPFAFWTQTLRSLIRTARTLEAERWQVCGEAWVRGQMSQVLGALRPFSLGARFETYEPFISSIFQISFGPRSTADTESEDTGVRLYILLTMTRQNTPRYTHHIITLLSTSYVLSATLLN
jgi:hypothetical protein